MARAKRDPKNDSRTARSELRSRAEPYWTVVEKGRAVGYRKGAKGGSIGPYTIERCIRDCIADMYSEGKPSAYDWEKRA